MALNYANNNSLSAITSLPASVSGGALTLLETQTASSSATISFTSNIDSTYDAYMFKYYDIHPSSSSQLKCNFSTDGGSNYNSTKTTTSFVALHTENDASTNLVYQTVRDLAQSTSDMWVSSTVPTDNDASCSGQMILFNPSSSVFVKHFITVGNSMATDPGSYHDFFGGYINTTSPVDAVRFNMSTGNIDSGTIKLYGIKDS